MFLVGLMALAVLAVMASPAMAKARPRRLVHGKTYVQIQDDETVSHIAVDEHVSSKLILNVNRIRDARRIRAGRWLYVPRVRTTEKHSAKVPLRSTAKTVTAPVIKKALVANYSLAPLSIVDEFEWKHVAGNPLKVHAPSEYEQILIAMGYPQEVSHRLSLRLMYGDPDGAVIIDKDGSVHRFALSPDGIASDFTMGSMASGSGPVKHLARKVVNNWINRDHLAAWLFYEKNGYDHYWYVALVKDCRNLIELRPVPEITREISQTSPSPPETELSPPEEQKAKEAVSWLWGIDTFAGVGAVFPDKGGHTFYSYWEAVGYPFIRDTDDGRYMLGVGIHGGLCEGKVPPTGFRFTCDSYEPGVFFKYISWRNGWDARIGFLWGHLHEYGHSRDRRYDSRRDIEHAGLEVNFNNYQRELEGKDTFTEWQIYGTFFPWVLNVDAHHSFDHQRIANTSDLRKHYGIVSAGARVFVKNWEWSRTGWPRGIRLGVGLEYFGELPQSESLNLWPLVLSDTDKIVFVGFGRSFDLGGGVDGWIVSAAIDPAQALRIWRGYARRLQVEKSFKNYDPATGMFKDIDNKGKEVLVPADISMH